MNKQKLLKKIKEDLDFCSAKGDIFDYSSEYFVETEFNKKSRMNTPTGIETLTITIKLKREVL